MSSSLEIVELTADTLKLHDCQANNNELINHLGELTIKKNVDIFGEPSLSFASYLTKY